MLALDVQIAEHIQSSNTTKSRSIDPHQNAVDIEIYVGVLFGYLRKENRCTMTTSEKKRVLPTEKVRIWHCAAVLFPQVPKKCTNLGLSLLYFLVLGTYSKFAGYVKYSRAGSAEMPFQNWYTGNTNNFRLPDFFQVEIRNTTGLCNKHRTAYSCAEDQILENKISGNKILNICTER
jgi:hypothetical protein